MELDKQDPASDPTLSQLVNEVFSDSGLVTIVVGHAAFDISMRLLKRASPLLETACDEAYGHRLIIETSPRAFRIFLGWLFKDSIIEDDQISLAKAWIFAAQYHMPRLLNKIMTKLSLVLEDYCLDPLVVSVA